MDNLGLSAVQWLAIVCTMLAAAGSSFTTRRDLPQSTPAAVVL